MKYKINVKTFEMAAILAALTAYGLPGLCDSLRLRFIEARSADPADDGPEVAILRARRTA